MDRVQLDYIKAKAKYDTAWATYRAECDKVRTSIMDGKDDSEEYANQVEAIADSVGLNEARIQRWQAEDRLLSWAHDKVKALPQYKNHAADIERVYNSPLLKIREQLIDLSLRLSA
jgi:hypothetical protein